MNIIKCIISYIDNKNAKFPVGLVKKFIEIIDQETFVIFRYLQSIYSYFNNNPSFIIYSLAYSIGLDEEYMQSIRDAYDQGAYDDCMSQPFYDGIIK